MDSEYLYPALNLLGVLVLLLIFIYIFKRIKHARDIKHNPIKIINTVPIGSKEKLILMEVNKAILLVGATPNHIETLYVFNELESEKSVADECSDVKGVFSAQMETTK